MKPVLKSKTTATVGSAAGGAGAFAFLLLSLIPQAIRDGWGPDGDAAFVALVAALGTTLVSRVVALLRKG